MNYEKKRYGFFKQAFDELENEGYFSDISSKIKRTSVRQSSELVVASPRAKYTVKRTRSSASTKKPKARSGISRAKVKVH